MSHLHVVDGVLPWWVVLAALAVGGSLVLALLRRMPEADRPLHLARVGVAGAALIVVMSLPLGPGIHLSLAPLVGMMLGAGGGFVAAFLANGFLAGLGHGGLTAVGVNGLFLGGQAVGGSLLFRLLRRRLGVRPSAVAATAATLAVAAAVALFALRALPLEAGHGDPHGDHHGDGWEGGELLVAALAVAAAVAETALTASIISFLARVRSDLVHGGAAPRPRSSGEPA